MSLEERSTTFLFMAHSSSHSMIAFWGANRNRRRWTHCVTSYAVYDAFNSHLSLKNLWLDKRHHTDTNLKVYGCHIAQLPGEGDTLQNHVLSTAWVHVSFHEHTVQLLGLKHTHQGAPEQLRRAEQHGSDLKYICIIVWSKRWNWRQHLV